MTTARSNDTFVGYVDEPPGRGTWSLIISCLLTLVLCVWSALHLNVPAQDRGRLSTLLLNFRWIVTGIYAPELVVFTAWRQWSSARLLNSIVRKQPSSHGLEGQMTSWSMAHSFFACTGGFAFEIDSLKDFVPSQSLDEAKRPIRLTLTARGVALLAKYGCLPHVPKEEIMDKSKANDLAKGAVIIQAGWMILQVIGRLCVDLPVTLLEVNTVAHVLCAFAMYLFWWDKPLLPEQPILIRDEKFLPLAIFMYISSEMSGVVSTENLQSQTIVKTVFAHMKLYSKTPEIETLALRMENSLEITEAITSLKRNDSDIVIGSRDSELTEETSVGDSHMLVNRAPTTCLDELKRGREKDAGTAFFERRPRIISEQSGSEPSSIDKKRWQAFGSAIHQYPSLFEDRIALIHEISDAKCIHLKPEQLLATHVQNWPGDDLLRSVNGLVVGMILWLANFCYGGIHAAAWNDHFPSTAEEWMWRGSALYIGFCGGLWVVLNCIVANCPPLNEFWERWMDGEKKWWQSFGLGLLVFICGFSLILARIFIVVEAFVSIRELPAAAYDTPEWTDIFPHF